MTYKLKVYSIWEYGKRKDAEGNPHQEDCTYPLPDNLKDSDRTFILCDGMGGHDAGEVASSTVCQAMGDYIANDGHDAEGIFTDEDLQRAIAAAFETLDAKDNGAEKKMGTTMTFLKLHNAGATIAHMGDSRVYHIRPGKDGESTRILFVTEDHSLVNDLVKVGEMTHEEARRSKQKNVITRAMQPNMDLKPKADVYHTDDIQAGDYFYMCSDGMLEQEEMENGESIRNIFSQTIKTDEEKVRILTKVTDDNKDNHTALIVHIESVDDGKKSVDDGTSVSPKKSSNKIFKLIVSIIAILVIVFACIVGFDYLSSIPAEKEDQKIEPTAQTDPEQEITDKAAAKDQEQNNADAQETQEPPEEKTPDPVEEGSDEE